MKNLKMIIHTLFVGLIATSTLNVNAQKKGMIGFRFMPSISSLKLNSASGGVVKGEVVLGFGIGGAVGFNFSEHVGVQGEIIYNSISQKYKEPNAVHQVNLKYINIPILLSLNTGRYSKINGNFVLGPQMGISMGSKLSTTGSDTEQAVLAIRKGDFGFAYGAGFDFGLNEKKSLRLAFGFRGVYGLMDISNNTNTTNKNTYYIIDKTNVQTYSIYTGLSLLF
jgi:hypothetical protein